MVSDFLRSVWDLSSGALHLSPSTFIALEGHPQGYGVAIAVILLAGLSQAIGQSIVLFVNRVKPFRFGLSLLMSAVLYLATYGFWATSIWLVITGIFRLEFQFLLIAKALALCYAPQLLAFLVAVPYFGVPISVVLSIWTLLAILVGLMSVTALSILQTVLCAGLGWLVLQLGQRTIGRPLTRLARWLMTQSAGQQLVTQYAALRAVLEDAQQPALRQETVTWVDEITPQASPPRPQRWYRVILLLLAGFFVISAIAASQDGLAAWFMALNRTTRLVIHLSLVSLVALGIAVLLTPLESLSWWAGWQGERPLHPGVAIRKTVPDEVGVTRYVTYLDGINQGTYGYLPIVERFLDRLAEALPPDILLVKGIIPYSVSNTPLTAQTPFAFLWRLVDSFKSTVPRFPIGFVINLRNLYAMMMSADARYGPIQNRGLAQVLYDSLRYHGYSTGSGTPITLIGFSGGGQMSMGAVPYLQQATAAPIEVISLSGVISGNSGAMQSDRIYHLVGQQDWVEKLGIVLSPARWPVALLSNWNKAKRRGRIVVISLGAVRHAGPRGPLGPKALLPDGRSHLQQTLDVITGILCEDWARTGLDVSVFVRPSNYELYQAAPFNRVDYYPVRQSLDQRYYSPQGHWLGRLILPQISDRNAQYPVGFEVYHAPTCYRSLQGQVLPLGWSPDPEVQAYVKLVTMDVEFAEQVQLSRRRGTVHPDRINHWPQVDPLESIAGAHPRDDVVVCLPDPVQVVETADAGVTLQIQADPVHISGRYRALVQILAPVGDDRFRVRHYDKAGQGFVGPEAIVYIPTVRPNRNGVLPSSNQGLAQSPLNQQGWYLFGAQNYSGEFVVQAIAPYRLFEPRADRVMTGQAATVRHINRDYWKDTPQQKGTVTHTLLLPDNAAAGPCSPPWQVGDRALLMELYGGVGGQQREFAPLGLFFGHFSFGLARVIPDPLTDQLRFDLEYRQIFTHSPEAVIAGSNHWTRFMGDRQFGRIGFRPVADTLIKFPPFTDDYDFEGVTFSPMKRLIRELDIMAARYRIGDGTGTTFVSPINSCVQDSAQALLTALKRMTAEFELNPLMLKWLREHPDHEQTQRFWRLQDLLRSLEANLNPLGFTRSDWRTGELTLGRFAGETPLDTLIKAAASWRSLLPRLAHDVIAMIFLQLGATIWVIRANQVGGDNPHIEPVAPTDFGLRVPKIKRARRYFKS